MYVSQDEIEFFKENGYLIKRGILDTELMERARERLWQGAPPTLKRDDPDTWVGPFPESTDDPNSVWYDFTWKFREPGSEDWMVQLLAKNEIVWGTAEQLLGQGTLEEPEQIRGIYCMMPEGNAPERPYRCHVDRHPFHLGVVGYIDRVAPNGGGFTVWPGSHRTFYHDFETRYTFNPTQQAQADIQRINEQPPMDCHGDAGDVVFWHHRIGHSAGHNRTRQIRQAVLYDFKKRDLEETQDQPPGDDMWIDWAI